MVSLEKKNHSLNLFKHLTLYCRFIMWWYLISKCRIRELGAMNHLERHVIRQFAFIIIYWSLATYFLEPMNSWYVGFDSHKTFIYESQSFYQPLIFGIYTCSMEPFSFRFFFPSLFSRNWSLDFLYDNVF
jgi:hypothetical protein